MKKIQTCILYGFILSGLFACKKESELVPNAPLPNLFAPSENATDPTSLLCREFYKETGVYLLFSDTLKNEYIGTDVYGNPLYNTELVDLTYGINSSFLWKFDFTYSTKFEEQERAADLVKEKVLPVLNKDDYPYSFLLIDKFSAYTWMIEEGEEMNDGYWSEGEEWDFYSGIRAMAISMSQLLNNTESLVLDIRKAAIKKFLTAEKLEDFYAYGKDYYGKYIWDFYSEEDFITATGILGFYFDEYDYYVEVWGSESDLDCFLTRILEDSEEEFKEEYAGYDLVLTKYDMLKRLLSENGFEI